MARESRGFVGGGPRAWPVLASTAGALFIRSYERGERVHLAMLSRGHDGRVDRGASISTPPLTWTIALTLPFLAAGVAATAMVAG